MVDKLKKEMNLKNTDLEEKRNSINKIEEYVWKDIANARRSLELIETFLKDLEKKSTRHLRNKDLPLTSAIRAAAIDSVIISLGRILEPAGKVNECTLNRYRNGVIEYIGSFGPFLNDSQTAKDNFEKLNRKGFLRELKNKQKLYLVSIKPWRDKVVAHTDMSQSREFPKNLSDIVSFVEEVHRVCHSAMEDTGIPDKYINKLFFDVSRDWSNCLGNRIH